MGVQFSHSHRQWGAHAHVETDTHWNDTPRTGRPRLDS